MNSQPETVINAWQVGGSLPPNDATKYKRNLWIGVIAPTVEEAINRDFAGQ